MMPTARVADLSRRGDLSMETVDFGSSEMLEDPFSFYEAKRAEAPVFSVPTRNMHVVTRHKDIEYVLRNPQLFSSQGRTPIVTYPGQRYQTTSDLVGTDAPEHRSIRTV